MQPQKSTPAPAPAFSKQYDIAKDHIDLHGIVDGLYYPFYFEWCRHAFAKDVLGFDLAERAKEGTNMVLVEQTIRFKAPLTFPGMVTVSCRAETEGPRPLTLKFIQEIHTDKGLAAVGTFTATCTSPASRRPFIPQDVLDKVSGKTAA